MIKTSSRSRFWMAGAVAALLVAAGPALAQGGHGGHGGGGGGFHGGGSMAGHGGGGAAHFGGRGYAGGGFSGGGRSAGFAGAHYAPRANFSVGARTGFAPRGNYVSSAGFRGGVSRPAFSHAAYGRGGFAPGYGRPGFVHGGYGRFWGGGYWHGGYWPRVSYGWGFPLFLPLLPAVYATYWWGGVPYYYANDVYYTYNTDRSGYVVTDPPPVAGTTDDSGGSQPAQTAPSSDVYAYPQNNQSDEQQSTDKYECHNWARSQTGFDPTHVNGEGSSGNASDYQRAMTACLNARGYSAQ